MELTAGFPFSLMRDGLLFTYPKLEKDQSSEVVIIGGGITGAIMAYHLCEAGIKVIVVDSRGIGLGSSCASTSLLQYELDIPLHILRNKIGEHAAVRSYQLCGQAIDELIQIMESTGYKEFEKTPSLYYSWHSRDKRLIEEEYEARKEAGFDVAFCTENEMKDNYGLNGCYGILSAKGAVMNSYTLTHHLFQYCIKKGVEVFDRSKVIGLENKNNVVHLNMENGKTLKASFVINATGYEVVNFIGKKLIDFDCTYALVSEPLDKNMPQWKQKVMMWNTDSPYVYLRITPDNRLMAGGRDEPFSNKTTRQLFLERKTKLLEKDLKKALPELRFKTQFSWSGTFGKTKDSLPLIGSLPGEPNILYALGLGGNGICFAEVAGRILRDQLTGRKNEGAHLFRFDR